MKMRIFLVKYFDKRSKVWFFGLRKANETELFMSKISSNEVSEVVRHYKSRYRVVIL